MSDQNVAINSQARAAEAVARATEAETVVPLDPEPSIDRLCNEVKATCEKLREAALAVTSLKARNETLERDSLICCELVLRLTDDSSELRAKLDADAKAMQIFRANLDKAHKRCEMAGSIAERLKRLVPPGGRMAAFADDILSVLDIADLPPQCAGCDYPLLHDETRCPVCDSKVEPKESPAMCEHDRRAR